MGVSLKQKDDGSASLHDNLNDVSRGRFGGPKTATATKPIFQSPITIQFPFAGGSDSAGGVFAASNPFGKTVIIENMIVRVTGTSTGTTNTLDIGVAATATTSAATLMTALDVKTATGVFDLATNKGASGSTRIAWASTEYVTASTASGNATAALAGTAFITCLVP